MEQSFVKLDYEHDLDAWIAFRSPIPTAIILSLYLSIVLFIGPKYMKDRKAYKLKAFIILYNIFQVISCYHIVSTILFTQIPILKFWQCTIYSTNSPEEIALNNISSFTYWLKVIELVETVVFVLRKKQNQVSFLHVFHHCATLTLVFILVKYYRGQSAMYPLFLNSNVHIIMYIYYLAAAALNDNIVKKLTPIKKFITTIQMVQFTLILLQVIGQELNGCPTSRYIVIFYTLVICIIFYLFYDFYQKTYNGTKSSNVSSKMQRKPSSTGMSSPEVLKRF